jgi:predicted ATP-dependent serine protease
MSSDRNFNKNLSKIFERMVTEGLLERGTRRGQFRRIEKEAEIIDFANADCSTILDLRWPAPFNLQRLVNLYPKNIVIVAGATNAGKTALLLNVVQVNMDRHRVVYFSSEMGPEELRLRLEKFDIPISSWRFEARERGPILSTQLSPMLSTS